MTPLLHLLSGGAAQGLVSALKDGFQAQHDCTIDAVFNAVGMMKDRLLAGQACDVVILTDALIAQLAASGDAVPGSARTLGYVKTGIACKEGETPAQLDSPAALEAALRAASGIYFPDRVKATAGVHFMGVLQRLGLADELAGRLHPHANGAAAMRAMAEATGTGLLGCTQVSEILYAPGVRLVAPLPVEFELATRYTAAVASRASQPEAARMLIDLLAGAETAALRLTCGFENG